MDPLILAVFAVSLIAALALTLWCIYATIDVLRRPAREWRGSGQNQTLWVVILIGSWFVGLVPFAAAAYWFIARPALKQVDAPILAS